VAGLTEGGEGRRESWDCEVEKVRKEKKRKRRRNRENGELKTEQVFISVLWKQGDRPTSKHFYTLFLAKRFCVFRQTRNYDETQSQEFKIMHSK